ncbi:MAG: hypothetical protein J5592_06220 [Clostridia bacterium]|jgi:hypothetical protein|nr:hypothetical protein [Clostridia bacterium]
MDRVMKITRRECLLALFSALTVVVCVCIGVTMNLTTLADENFDHMGLRTFCMFTVNSNILAAGAMAMVIPYTMDGLRTHNYHLPRWIVDVVYAGVTAVALTFLVSLFILAPVKGFLLIFSGSRFFLHGVCPVLAVIAFCFFMSQKRMGFWDSLFALIPVIIYAAVYFVMVVVIGEENGGWNDFYGFATFIPWWVSAIALVPVSLLIATGIRALHNRSRDRRKAEETAFFTETFAGADVRKIVAAMARSRSSAKVLDIVVPTRVISILIKYSGSDCTMEEAAQIYLKEYLECSGVMNLDRFWI